MRLDWAQTEQLESVFDILRKPCRWDKYKNDKICICCSPEYAEYERKCDEITKAWLADKASNASPVYPPATIQCEKCEYSDKELGRLNGEMPATW